MSVVGESSDDSNEEPAPAVGDDGTLTEGGEDTSEITGVTDPVGDDVDEPEEEAPTEATPAEDTTAPVEDDNEADESLSIMGAEIMASGDSVTYTVNPANSLTVEFKSGVEVDDTHKDGENITFTIADADLTDESVLPDEPTNAANKGEVKVTSGGTDITATFAAGVYTIAAADVTGAVVITIKAGVKEYSVSAPTDTDDVTWKIKTTAAEATYGAGPVKVTKSESVKLQATLAGEDDVDVTVNGVKQTLTDAATPKEFTVAVATLIDEKGEVKEIEPVYDVKKTPVTVKIKETKDSADVAYGTNLTATYKNLTDTTFGDAYKPVQTNGEIAAKKDDEIALIFAAKADGKTVDTVTFGSTAVTGTVNDDGETVYKVKAVVGADAAATAAANTVAVTLKDTKVITIKKDKDAKISKVTYGTSNTPARKTADGWKVESDAAVALKVTAEAHQEITYIHKGATAHTAGCTNDIEITAANEVTVAASDYTMGDAGETLTIGTQQIVIDYTLTAPAEDTGVTVEIQDAKGTKVNAKGTSEAEKNVYALNDGETYSIKVSEGTGDAKKTPLDRLDSVKVANVAKNYSKNKDAFVFTADVTETGAKAQAIVVALKAAEGYDITFVMNGDTTADPIDNEMRATVKAGKYYQKTETTVDTTTTVTKTEVDAEENAKDIAAIASAVKYEAVWEKTDFSFTLKAKENYQIAKVQTKVGTGEWTDLTGTEGGVYTLKAVTAATTVKVFTELDPKTAYSITFNADENVKEVKADLTGTAVGSDTEAMTLGEVNYLKKADNAKVLFTIVPQLGYTVDKVTFGTGETDVLTADSGVYTYGEFTDAKKAAVITISTKANTLSADKVVTFAVGEGVDLKIKTENVPTETKNNVTTYTLTAHQPAADGKAEVKEIPELVFDLTVPYGTYLPSIIADNDGAAEGAIRSLGARKKSEDGSTWTYSYKLVANLLTGTAASPQTILTDDAYLEGIHLTKKIGSEDAEVKDYDEFVSLDEFDGVFFPGETVILKVAKGQTLEVNGEDVTKDLDGSYKYSFVAKLDDTKENDTKYEINVKAAETSYQIGYKLTEAGTSYEPASEDAVEVSLNQKVYLQLTDGTVEVPISKYVKTENAASVVTVADAQNAAGKGLADVVVKDEAVSVDLYTVETDTLTNGIVVEEEVKAATIKFTSKDAAGKTLTAKGITNNKKINLDATSITSYALTLKEGKKVLNAAAYDDALAVATTDATIAKAKIDDGKLYVTTLKGANAEATITISAKGSTDALLTFTVVGKDPALKMKSVTSANQGMHDILLDVAADASIKPIATDDFKLLYEVSITKKDGPGADPAATYYLDATDANGKTVPVSQLFKVNSDTDANCANTYTFDVRLVAVAKTTTVTAGTPVTGAKGTKLSAVLFPAADAKSNGITKDFKTRAAYYEDKLGVTKETTKFYSGQQDVVVAIPKFSGKASHIEDVTAVVYKKDGSLAAYNDGSGPVGVWAESVDPKTMAVKVSSDSDMAGNYDVVIYATATKVGGSGDDADEFNMYRASAKVPITIQKSINDIELDYPSQVAVLADKKGNKKDVSVTLKTLGVYEYDYNGKAIKAQTQKFDYTLGYVANSKNEDKIVVKGSKVTIKKDFIVGADPDDNIFYVLVEAKDYSDNGVTSYAEIHVADKALEIASVRLLDEDGKALGQTITTKDLAYAYVELKDANGQWIDPSLVTLTPNKGKIYVDSYGDIQQTGYQKNLTIKAVTKDGGKKSKSSVKYTINYPTGLTYSIDTVNVLGVNSDNLGKTGDNSYVYTGTGNNKINFNVMAKIGDAAATTAYTKDFNYSVKIDGGKNTSNAAWGYYSITPSKDIVKVTITDKTKKAPNTVVYTFKDNGWQTAKAPKATTKDKLYVAYGPNTVNSYGYTTTKAIKQSLTYTVSSTAYNAVKLTKVSDGYLISNQPSQTVLDIAPNGTFTLSDLLPYSAGTTKYAAVYGNKENGVFYPKTSATTLAIKVNKAGTPKAVTSYTINPDVSLSVPLQAKPVPVNGMVVFDKVLSANVGGEPNQFYDYFEVVNGKLQIKSTKATATELGKLNLKTDLTGYLVYRVCNGNSVITKQDKITVKLSSTAPKYTATAVNIVAASGASATTTVKLGNTPVTIAKVLTDTTGWTAAIADAEAGAVTLTATTEPTSGKVDLYVIPAGSRNAATAATTVEGYKEAGAVKVQVQVNTKAADDKATKITVSGNAIPVASINTDTTPNTVDLTVTLKAGKNFTYKLSNATINGATKKAPAEGTAADARVIENAVKRVNWVSETGTITIVLDRDKVDANKTVKVPVNLTFTAGAAETVSFPVKTQKIPTMKDVKAIVEKELKDYQVSAANYDNAEGAKAAVQAKCDDLNLNKISALSGIRVTDVKVDADTDASKFGDTTVGETTTPGHHTVKVTLTDLTKPATDTTRSEEISVKVTKAEVKPTLAQALSTALDKYRLVNSEGNVDIGKTKADAALTQYDVQKALQDAVDSVAPKKYLVKITSWTFADSEPDEQGNVTRTALSFTFTVKDAISGATATNVDANGVSVVINVAEPTVTGLSSGSSTTDPTPTTKPGTVTLSEISGAASITIPTDTTDAEETYSVTVTLSGDDNATADDQKVTWSFKETNVDSSKIILSNEADGTAKVTVKAGATAGTTVTLVATSNYDEEKVKEKVITLAE